MMKQFVILFILILAQLFGIQPTAEHLSKSEISFNILLQGVE